MRIKAAPSRRPVRAPGRGPPLVIPPVRYPALPRAAADAAGFVAGGLGHRRRQARRPERRRRGRSRALAAHARCGEHPRGSRRATDGAVRYEPAHACGRLRRARRVTGSRRAIRPAPTRLAVDRRAPLGEDAIGVDRGVLRVDLGQLRGATPLPLPLAGGRHAAVGCESRRSRRAACTAPASTIRRAARGCATLPLSGDRAASPATPPSSRPAYACGTTCGNGWHSTPCAAATGRWRLRRGRRTPGSADGGARPRRWPPATSASSRWPRRIARR